MGRFHDIIDLKSSYVSDKIAIAANVAGIELCYKGPETTHDQCRWILAKLALFAGDLAILCGNGPALQMTAEVNSSSWMRWFNEIDNYAFTLSGPAFPERASIVSIHHERIILGLLVLKDYTILVPSTKYMLIAESFVKRHRDLVGKVSTKELKDAVDVLRCSLECGLPWLLESMTFSKDIANGMDLHMSASDMDFGAPVYDLLIQAYPEHETTLSSLTNAQKRSVVQHIVFLLCFPGEYSYLSEYTSGLLSRTTEPGATGCYCVDWGGGLGKALMFITSKRVTGCCLAVPVVLSDSRWSTSNRLWILKPLVSPTGGHWTIIDKTRLVTPRPLEEEGGLVFQAAQTIRG